MTGTAGGIANVDRPANDFRDGGDQQIVLGTKLTAPPLGPGHIVPERLLDVLDAATTRPLTLLSAPTGFGKTTLLAASLTGGIADQAQLHGLLAGVAELGLSLVSFGLVAPGQRIDDGRPSSNDGHSGA